MYLIVEGLVICLVYIIEVNQIFYAVVIYSLLSGLMQWTQQYTHTQQYLLSNVVSLSHEIIPNLEKQLTAELFRFGCMSWLFGLTFPLIHYPVRFSSPVGRIILALICTNMFALIKTLSASKSQMIFLLFPPLISSPKSPSKALALIIFPFFIFNYDAYGVPLFRIAI